MAGYKQIEAHGKQIQEYTPEERAAFEEQRQETLKRRKMLKQTMAPIIYEFLMEKFPVKENGEEKQIDGVELIKRTFRKELAKGGTTAVQMLKVMNDIMQGNPKIVAQFNFNTIDEKDIGTDLKEEFLKLRGNAEDVEVIKND